MQTDHKEIYKKTAERTGKSEQLYKDLGNFVFTELMNSFKKPKSLIIKLKGIGSWRLRRKRMQIVTENYSDPLIDQFTSFERLQEIKEKEERHNLFLERLKEYDEYVEDRKKIREKRNETQILLRPDKRED